MHKAAAKLTKIVFCTMPLDGNETRVICPVLPQDKMGLDKMVKVYYCCCRLLADVWSLNYLNKKLPSLS